MRKFITCMMLFLVWGATAAAWAQEDDLYSAEYFACLERPEGQTTTGMVECMGAERSRQDAKLNAAYQKLMQTLPDERKEILREAQRAWIKFRDAYAEFLYGYTGGSIDRLNTAGWYMRSTAMQARELENMLIEY